MTDEELLTLLKIDGEEGSRALCKAYAALATGVARRILKDPQDVEEVAADAMVTVWEKCETLRPDTLRGFIATAARNLAVDRWRQLRRRGEVSLEDWDGEEGDCLESMILGEELQRKILEVSPPDGEMFLRHYVLLESAREIAARFGLTESAVHARLHRTRKILQKEVRQDG